MRRQEQLSVRTDHLKSAGEVFRMPIIIGLATAVGLVSALVGDDVWDVVSWLTILAPVVVVGLAWRRSG